MLCYVAKLDAYFVILGDDWLQQHNPAIDWKDQIMRFNSALCIKEGCLPRGISCIKYAIGSKVSSRFILALYLSTQDKHCRKLTAHLEDNAIDIQLINAKHFFRMARQKDHKGYMWVPRVFNTNCINKDCFSASHAAK